MLKPEKTAKSLGTEVYGGIPAQQQCGKIDLLLMAHATRRKPPG
jgi:hypothetical protein